MDTAFVSLSVKHHLLQVKNDFKKHKFQTPEPSSFLLHSPAVFHFLKKKKQQTSVYISKLVKI